MTLNRGDEDLRTDPAWGSMYDRNAIGVATLRRDGFCALNAGGSVATLTTRPVRFSGSHLFVNVDAARGEYRAEVLDVDGRPIEGFTAHHDAQGRLLFVLGVEGRARRIERLARGRWRGLSRLAR